MTIVGSLNLSDEPSLVVIRGCDRLKYEGHGRTFCMYTPLQLLTNQSEPYHIKFASYASTMSVQWNLTTTVTCNREVVCFAEDANVWSYVT